jgi:hypothetical protein
MNEPDVRDEEARRGRPSSRFFVLNDTIEIRL